MHHHLWKHDCKAFNCACSSHGHYRQKAAGPKPVNLRAGQARSLETEMIARSPSTAELQNDGGH